MTRARTKAHLTPTTASAPPAGTTTGMTALTVECGWQERASHLGQWDEACSYPLWTYGRRLVASATSHGVVADSSPLASTSTQTLDDSPTPMWTLDGPSASGVGSVKRLPFLHTSIFTKCIGVHSDQKFIFFIDMLLAIG